MKSLYLANFRRLSKSVFYILGLLIAFAATFLFTNETIQFEGLFSQMSPAGRTCFISICIIAFFTIYTPISICSEYSEGIIRNKIISGYSQKQIYFSGLFIQYKAVFIMWIANILGGVAGGARPSGSISGYMLILLIAMMSYTTLIYSISFKLQKPIRSVIASFLLINLCINAVLAGNFIIMISKGMALKIAAICYNINVMGQWMTKTGLTDPEADPGSIAQILISCAVIALSVLIGTAKLEKRDIQ